MPYKKDPVTNQIIKLDQFGPEFDHWEIPTDNELLEEAKSQKLLELKNLRNEELLRPIEILNSTTQTIVGEGKRKKKNTINNKRFNINTDDIVLFGSIISILETSGGTRNWTNISKERVTLDINDYRSLRNHLLIRDETIYNIYTEKQADIEACQTLEELERVTINFI